MLVKLLIIILIYTLASITVGKIHPRHYIESTSFLKKENAPEMKLTRIPFNQNQVSKNLNTLRSFKLHAEYPE